MKAEDFSAALIMPKPIAQKRILVLCNMLRTGSRDINQKAMQFKGQLKEPQFRQALFGRAGSDNDEIEITPEEMELTLATAILGSVFFRILADKIQDRYLSDIVNHEFSKSNPLIRMEKADLSIFMADAWQEAFGLTFSFHGSGVRAFKDKNYKEDDVLKAIPEFQDVKKSCIEKINQLVAAATRDQQTSVSL